MKPQRVLVTGSAGTIGKVAVRALLARGHQVRGFDRVPSSEVAPGSVANERQRGYTIGDRLLRPALVEVAVAPLAPPTEGNS